MVKRAKSTSKNGNGPRSQASCRARRGLRGRRDCRPRFFDRFRGGVGLAPMECLAAWRMALAKTLLRRREGSTEEVARRVGYGSASAFSVAFARSVGLPPGAFAAQRREG